MAWLEREIKDAVKRLTFDGGQEYKLLGRAVTEEEILSDDDASDSNKSGASDGEEAKDEEEEDSFMAAVC